MEPSKPSSDTQPAKTSQGVVDTLREKSLKAAGVNFLLADASLIASGLLAGGLGGKFMMGAGASGLSAGLVGINYGNPKAEHQLNLIYTDLRAHLKKNDIAIPTDHTPEALAKDGGLLSHIETFLQRYPTQVMNTLYSTIGLFFLLEGREAGKAGLVGKKKDMTKSGSLLVAAGLAGLLIPEKKPDPNKPPQNIFERAYAWVQEKPLRVTGTLMTINQFFLGKVVLGEHKKAPFNPSTMFKMVAVASFVLGNTLLALSSKSEGGGKGMDEKTLNALADTSARLIAAQPEAVRESLLENVAGFLSKEPYVEISEAELRQKLKERLDKVMGKGRTNAESWQGRVAAQAAQAEGPAQPSL